MQADILGRQIIESVQRNDLKAALAACDEFRKLKVPMPPPLLFLEARAAKELGDPIRAFNALEEFLKVAPREGRQYQEAVALYGSYQAAATAERQRRDAARQQAELARKQAEAQAAAERQAAVLARVPDIVAAIEASMVEIPAGKYRRGDLSGPGRSDEKPVRTVTVGRFGWGSTR